MRIAIDLTAFIPQMTGVDTYLKQLVASLAKVDRTNQYRIYHNHEDRRLFADNLPENFSHRSLSARPRLLWVLPLLFAGLVADSTGEMIGYVYGGGNAMKRLSDMEFHRERYLTRHDRLAEVEA